MSLSLSGPGGVLVWPGGTLLGSEESSSVGSGVDSSVGAGGGADCVAVGGTLVDWDVPSSAGGGYGVDSSVGGGGGVAVGGSDVSPPGGG